MRRSSTFFSLRYIVPIVAVVYIVMFFLDQRFMLLIISPIVFGYAPGYMISKALDLRRLDQIEVNIFRVVASVVIGAVIYYSIDIIFNYDDLYLAASLCGAIALALTYFSLKDRSVTSEQSGTSGIVLSKQKLTKVQKLVAVFCIIVMISSVAGSTYILLTQEETGFTEFYILDETGSARDLPIRYTVGENQDIIVGIVNHENKRVNYTIEVWLVNYTLVNMAVNVTKMYFYDRFSVTLDNVELESDDTWVPQFEAYYGLNFSVPGNYYLYFMMFKDTVEDLPEPYPMDPVKNYNETAASWRVVQCVNSEIQFVRTITVIS